ncbi:hypothetical protein SAMN05192542_104221 [Paraburkholderia caballeronis]|uniref:Uncharacterized protein n=1 Tax=Paraburkholderia caballeronis TaxID=416943 RepID=A0A1H7L7Z7_9BURK|nr:hypothetical protein C7403_102221 [Paraburkholderia caballeronis]PXX03695.1 hypothetical protein C7407_102221 [Paraburkholderia caballeronis]RAK04439.1 hypothetical protein C7409_102221 [Paraburkholderia caballeronis]SEK94950.1 hypothetical protein SAMN05192542_104221 [Paraburkholderia caballeronis]
MWLAELDGYLNHGHDAPHRAAIMWRGFLTLHGIIEVYRIFRQSECFHFMGKGPLL